ncbi:MAG: ribosome biogenesis GTPase Der [bacterium]|nr:ribosome biogenesis GTPase Der [bacterium]MBU1918211.1 ribosome biogenesis GTPase Der [bacterium]
MQNNLTQNIPLIAIIGRPNVGKSTLFNRLSQRWNSIVEGRPGITRDRLIAEMEIEGHACMIMDTGGLQVEAKTRLERKMSEQALKGVEDADVIIFVFDGRDGVTPMDQEWVKRFRKVKKPKIFVVNKLDDPTLDDQAHEFYSLGIGPIVPLSTETQRNFTELYDEIAKSIAPMVSPPEEKVKELGVKERSPSRRAMKRLAKDEKELEEGSQDLRVAGALDISSKEPECQSTKDEEQGNVEKVELAGGQRQFRVAIIGRPNVGKSTLLNTILNEERCIVDDVPGTTRDPIDSLVVHNDIEYRFVDTAGIRKRARTTERVDKFSVVASLKHIENSDLVLLLLDSQTGPTEQDAHVAGYAFEKDRAIIVLANKWDEGQKLFTKEEFEHRLELKMNYLNYCPVLYISAKTGKNVTKIFEVIEALRKQYEIKITTGALNRAFENIISNHPLPIYKGQEIKMYYATQVKSSPPSFVVFCNYPKQVHFSYERYLINSLRKVFKLQEVPVRVIFKGRKK